MKRDFDLVREILLAVEAIEPGRQLVAHQLEVAGATVASIVEHARLLVDSAGYIDGSVKPIFNGPYSAVVVMRSLTWPGHDYLDTVRDERTWAKVREYVAEKGGSLTLEVVKAVGTAVLLGRLGLSP